MRKLFFLIFIIPLFSWGQNLEFSFETTHQLTQHNKQLSNPWAGGLNSPQFSTIDINSDGHLDVFIYDRTAQKVYTYIASPSLKKYIYNPNYENLFPNFEGAGWVLSYDYNYDNKKDLFVGYNFGVQVYKNISSSSLPSFSKEYNLLETESSNISFRYNLPIFSTDIPAFNDIDADGDLDVLFLDFHNGQMELHLNRSQERYNNANFLEFERINFCWGDFLIQEINCDDIIFDIACPFNNLKLNDGRNKVNHTGSSVLVLDINADGLLDLLVSGVSCNKTYVMINQGTNKGAVFRSFTSQYPTSFPINLGVFTALYSEDLDFDGQKDLIATSNLDENENNIADFSQSVWFYKNVGSHSLPQWNFIQKDFFQDNMLDVNQGASSSFTDIDGDGDLDLFVGNKFFFSNQNTPKATIKFYRNKGNVNQANFVLEDEDFMQLSQYGFIDIEPQWKDLNNDGSTDFGFTATNSDNKTSNFYFFSNLSPKQKPVQLQTQLLPFPIKLEKGDKPFFYDLDLDGDLDILNIKSLGNIVYLENNKTMYVEKVKNVLNIQISALGRNPSITIADFDLDGKDDLAFINNLGFIEIYPDIRTNFRSETISNNQIIKNRLDNQIKKHNFGLYPHLSDADINGDKKPDLILGLYTGGIQILSNIIEKDPLPLIENKDLLLSPNPSYKYIYIKTLKAGIVDIYSYTGQLIFSSKIESNIELPINVETWASSLYVVHFKDVQGAIKTTKFIKTNN